MIQRKIISLFIIVELIFSPVLVVAESSPKPIEGSIVKEVNNKNFSTSTVKAISQENIDWNNVDLESEIILPQEMENYHKQLQEKLNSKRFAEAKTLLPSKRKIKDILQKKGGYSFSKNAKNSLLPQSSSSTQTIIHFDKNTKKILPKKSNSYQPLRKIDIQKIETTKLNSPSNTILKLPTQPSLKEKVKNMSDTFTKKVSFKDFLLSIFATPVHAIEGRSIIEFTPEVETRNLDHALYFISQHQNPDGSFGEKNVYKNTFKVVELLSKINKTDNDQYPLALRYLREAETDDNQSLAFKIRILHSSQLPYQQYLEQLLSSQNPDGGYGLKKGYESDLFSTLEVINTLTALGYNENNTLTKSLVFAVENVKPNGAVHFTQNSNPSYYLINSLLHTLQPYQDSQLQGENENIIIREKINLILQFLASEVDREQGNLHFSNDAIDIAMTLQNFERYNVQSELQPVFQNSLQKKQTVNGSFNNSLEETIESLQALATPDVIIQEILLPGPLHTGNPSSFILTLKNNGYKETSDIDLHVFVDNFYFAKVENLRDRGVVLAPGQSVQVRVPLQDTTQFTGDVKITTYIELPQDMNFSDNWRDTIRHWGAPQNNTNAVLPLYFTVQSNSVNGTPGISVQWPNKSDANRSRYILMLRPQGQNQWIYLEVNNNLSSLLLSSSSFIGETIYEITFGVADRQNNIVYFSDFVPVRVSGQDNAVMGSIRGNLTQDNIPLASTTLFVNGGRNESSNGNGEFFFNNISNGSVLLHVTSTPHLESLSTLARIQSGVITENVRVFTHLKGDTVPPQVTQVGILNREGTIPTGLELNLFADGTDNIAIQGGVFYIFNPQIQEWEYLGEAPTRPGTNRAEFQWFIPADKTGEGFKVKAVLFDYQNNISEELESDSFNLINGNAPEFTILSPQANNRWELGSTQIIQWRTSLGSNVPVVNVSVLYGDTSETIASNIPNTGSFEWRLPLHTLYAGENLKVKIQGEDRNNQQNGESISEGVFHIVNSSTLPAAPWGVSESITFHFSHQPFGGGIGQSKSIITSDGTVHLVYRYIHDTFVAPRVVTEKLYYTKRNLAGVWSEPVTIYSREQQTNENLIGYSWIEDFNIEKTSDNRLVLIFNTAHAGGCSNLNQNEIFTMMQNEAGEWGQPINISNNQTTSILPRIASGHNSTVHVLWADGVSFDANCNVQGQRTLNYKKYSVAQGWEPGQIIPRVVSPYYTQMISTDNGSIHITYRDSDNGQIKYVNQQNNVWQNPQIIYPSGYESNLIKGKNNTFHLVVKEIYNDEQQGRIRSKIMYIFFDGSNFQAPQEVFVDTPQYNFENPSVSIDEQNRPHISAEGIDPQTQIRKIFWTMKQGQNFLPSQIIHQEYQGITPGSHIVSNGGWNVGALYKASYSLQEHLFWAPADIQSLIQFLPLATGVQASQQNGSIRLSWNPYQAEGFNHFALFRTIGVTSTLDNLAPIAQIRDINRLHYTDSNVTTNTLYYYAVSPVDQFGNRNPNVNWIGPVTSSMPLVNLIRDGNMELATLHDWRNINLRAQKTTSSVYNGEQSAFMSYARIGGIQQSNIPIQPGRRYRLTMRAKIERGSFWTYVSANNGAAEIQSMRGSLSASSTWQYYSREFVAPANSQNLQVLLQIRSGSVYVDDVELIDITPAAPQMVVPVEVSRDGSMEENGLQNWSVYLSPLLIQKTASTTHSGRQSLRIMTRAEVGKSRFGGAMQNNLRVQAGRRYRLRFWYRVERGYLYPRLAINNTLDFELPSASQPRLLNTNRQWRQYERVFTVPQNFAGDFRLIFRFYSGEGYIDDVTIEEMP